VCGIAGWVDPRGRVTAAVVGRMARTLAHRGPDGHGIWEDPRGLCALAHRRLAIVDLSPAAAQPMAGETPEVWLVANGEVYGFRELRRRLERAGHRFRSGSDCEVLVHGYEEWGIEGLLARLNGMFAFALWDAGRAELHLVRDRLGIKPLYYARLAGGGLAFASLPRALLEHPGVARALDPGGLEGYLAYGYVPHERSIFRGVRKLRPGHRLRWRGGEVELRRWWRLEYAPGRAPEAAERIGALVADAVRVRMVADVPVGSFLSGGLDSSTVTARAVRHADGGLDTFCVGFDAGTADDLHYSRLVAARLGTRHHVREVTGSDAARLLSALQEVLDEPLYDPSALATWLLAELARRRVKVVLSGTGGDEVFAGYGWFASQVRYARRRAALGPLGRLAFTPVRSIVAVLRRLPGAMRLSGVLKLAGMTQPERSFYVHGFFDSWEIDRLLGRRSGASGAERHLWLHRRTWREGWPLVPALLAHDLESFLPDNCLALLDRTTMAHGLEARVPLLDHRVVEAVFALPWETVSTGDGDKRLLRAVARGLVPDEVLERPKCGFSPPFKVWLRRGDLELSDRALLGGALARDGVIDPSFVERLRTGRALRRWNKLWLLLNLEWWYRRWIVGQDRSPRIVATPSGEPR